jgi:hypothetical protein
MKRLWLQVLQLADSGPQGVSTIFTGGRRFSLVMVMTPLYLIS